MGRKDRSRKRARKARVREEHEARAKAEEGLRLHPPPPEPVNHSRLRQVFATMSFRAHEKGGSRPFKDHVLGPTVKASTPEELAERTDEAYVGETLKQEPS
jgi:hypothetical protein